MTRNINPRPPVAAGCGRVYPQELNLPILLDVLDRVAPQVENLLPRKRSGYSYAVHVLFQAYIQLTGGSVKTTGERLNTLFKESGKSYQKYHLLSFSNKKRRRFFPDQPALSRCLQHLAALGLTEAFWNEVNFAHVLLLKHLGIVRSDINIIADYKEVKCPKDDADPYCFGKLNGKTVHKTLVFSILSGTLHQIVSAFKIARQQHKLPLFADVIKRLKSNGFTIKHALLDRGFYRKEIFVALKRWGVSIITPGRQCTETKSMITNYLAGKGSRYGIGHLKLKYVRKQGYMYLEFEILLCAKRSYTLDKIKDMYNKGNLALDKAASRIFPLILIVGSARGITKMQGNEKRARMLYRSRWNIEIAFREMNRLGIAARYQHRDGRLAAMGARILVYNIWQVQRYLVKRENPNAMPLELNEFLGRGCIPRKVRYLKNVGKS